MKKGLKIVSVVFIIAIVAFLLWSYLKINSEQKQEETNYYTKKAVIVKTAEKYLSVMGLEGPYDLYNISYEKEDNINFKQGQEIIIYYDGTIQETFPASIPHIQKIEIVKEKSDIEIPMSVLKFYNSSANNVNVTVNEITNSDITITITDTNRYPYEYTANYVINKKVKNPNYTGVGQKIGEDTDHSTSGYTRNRFRIHMARGRKIYYYFK